MSYLLSNNQNSGSQKELRADAVRNKALILDAAEKVFAEEGLTASSNRVAARAGVGIGTVFRHFPTKELLLHAVLDRQIAVLVTEAKDLVTQPGDNGRAFFLFLHRAFELTISKRLIMAALAEASNSANLDEGNRVALLGALGTLLERAQSSGAVRPDVSLDEVIALMQGLLQSVKYMRSDKTARTHVLNIVLDGLRTTTVRE